VLGLAERFELSFLWNGQYENDYIDEIAYRKINRKYKG